MCGRVVVTASIDQMQVHNCGFWPLRMCCRQLCSWILFPFEQPGHCRAKFMSETPAVLLPCANWRSSFHVICSHTQAGSPVLHHKIFIRAPHTGCSFASSMEVKVSAYRQSLSDPAISSLACQALLTMVAGTRHSTSAAVPSNI
jgi:hypothetical protein